MQSIHTKIWLEEPENDNPYATKAAYCHGYNVYDEMLGNCRWVEMLFLLLKGEAPTQQQADLLEHLAVVLANAGPRDAAVHAAMCAGVGKSVAASSLIAALAVGAGQYSGAREVYLIMECWNKLGTDENQWENFLLNPSSSDIISTWPDIEHIPGFDPYGNTTPTSIITILKKLQIDSNTPYLQWLFDNRTFLEKLSTKPITITMVAATAFIDLGLTLDEGEMLMLLLRLPGAAAHTLEQKKYGHKNFPFYPIKLESQDNKESR